MPAKKDNKKANSTRSPSKAPGKTLLGKKNAPKSRSAKRQSAKLAAKTASTKSASAKTTPAKSVKSKFAKTNFATKSAKPLGKKPAPKAAAVPTKTKVTHKASAGKPAKAPFVQAPGRPKAPAAPRVDVPQSQAEKFAIEAALSLHDDKCTEVVILDVRGKNPMTDFLVVASGTSDRQMRAVLQHVQELGEKLGYSAVRHTSDDRATWLLADFMNVIVHLFEPNTRAHYDIEMMWGDAPRIHWERPGTTARDRAGLNAGETI